MDEIYCADVGGVFSVGVSNQAEGVSRRRVLDSQLKGPITALAASSRQVVWVEDLSGKQLRVRVLRLP